MQTVEGVVGKLNLRSLFCRGGQTGNRIDLQEVAVPNLDNPPVRWITRRDGSMLTEPLTTLYSPHYAKGLSGTGRMI